MEIKELLKGSFLILGVGNADRGDDGIGNYVVSKLQTKNKLDCGPMPENFADKIRDKNPEVVLIIDAVDFGGKPGEVILTEAEKTEGITVSTHSMPLALFCKLIPHSKVYLLGIQPESFEKMSKKVQDAADKLTNEINEFLR